MADEAFALSPISARAVQPSEEDYAAISEAFMETARGRWFLGEYAKRNRNADTHMVLDAVARIEQTLAAQRQATASEANGQALAEALAAIRGAVDAAQAPAIEAVDGLALNERLAPVRKGARVIREIAWRLREIGNDSRICDLIDSQVSVIEAGAGHFSSDEVRSAVSAAFAAIKGQIAEFDDSAPAQASEAASAPPSPARADERQDELPVAVAETNQAGAPPESSEAPGHALPTEAEAALAEMELAEAELAQAELAKAEAEAEAAVEATAEIMDETTDVDDEALLDMVAMEMGAPDPLDDEIDALLAEEARIAEPVPEEAEPVAAAPEPVAEAAPAQPVSRLAEESLRAVARELSLGSSLIASGLVGNRNAAANDPLAPIRRMSQVEKIALFS